MRNSYRKTKLVFKITVDKMITLNYMTSRKPDRNRYFVIFIIFIF